MKHALIHDANQFTFQRFIRNHRPARSGTSVFTVEGACITARPVARHGLPADATCYRTDIEHPEGGWTIRARVVWRDGKQMAPLATHCVIERYFADDEALVADEDAACLAANEWFRGVPL